MRVKATNYVDDDIDKIKTTWQPTGTFHVTQAQRVKQEQEEEKAKEKARDDLEKKIAALKADNAAKERLIKQAEEDRIRAKAEAQRRLDEEMKARQLAADVDIDTSRE